jgi:hypothetical protein
MTDTENAQRMLHTTGPWLLQPKPDTFHGRGYLSIHSTSRSIARVTCYGLRDHGNTIYSPSEYAEALANGHLIAAAPELLAALDYLLEQTVEMDLEYGIALSEGEDDARAKALAAIAKATVQDGEAA